MELSLQGTGLSQSEIVVWLAEGILQDELLPSCAWEMEEILQEVMKDVVGLPGMSQ